MDPCNWLITLYLLTGRLFLLFGFIWFRDSSIIFLSGLGTAALFFLSGLGTAALFFYLVLPGLGTAALLYYPVLSVLETAALFY